MQNQPTMRNWYLILITLLIGNLSSSGQGLNWVQEMNGGSNGHISIRDMAIDVTGNVTAVGSFSGIVDFDPDTGTTSKTSAGNSDIFIAKYNPQGALLWVNSYGSTSLDAGDYIALDDNDNIYVAGRYQNTVNFGGTSHTAIGSWDIFLAKYSSSGTLRWVHSFGQWKDDDPEGLAVGDSNHVYLSGSYSVLYDLDPDTGTHMLNSHGFTDMFIAKYDGQGNFQWAHDFGSNRDDVARQIAVTDSNDVIMQGLFWFTVDFDPGAGVANLTAKGIYDMMVLCLDKNGNFKWVNQIGSSDDDFAAGIVTDHSGHVYIAGIVEDTADLDPGTGVKLVGGYGGFPNRDIFLAKYNSANGSMVWAHGFATSQSESVLDVTLDTAQNPVMTGYFISTLDFDPGPDSLFLSTDGTADMVIAKYHASTGYLDWGFTIGGDTYSDWPYDVAVDQNNDVYVQGVFGHVVDFDPSVRVDTIGDPTVSQSRFLAKYSTCYPMLVNDSAQICQGDSFIFPDGDVAYSATIDTSLLGSSNGCDSMVVTQLTINPVQLDTDSVVICSGDNFMLPNGMMVSLPGTYNNIFTNQYGCDSSITTVLDTVGVDAGVSMTGNELSAVLSGATYQWLNCDDSTTITGETSQIFTPATAGNYAVIVNDGFCIDTSNCVAFNFVGLQENLEKLVQIFPNPVNDQLNIVLTQSEAQVLVRLFNLQGQLLLEANYQNQKEFSLSTDRLVAGQYLLEIQWEEKRVRTSILVNQ